MFCLEIGFKDTVSPKETILIRRPQALIGSQDQAHVVLFDMRHLDFQIRIGRDVGSQFRVISVPNEGARTRSATIDGLYDRRATLDIGPLILDITSLDCDLMLKDDESPDAGGLRILRQSVSHASPEFPALVVKGSPTTIVSFAPGQAVYVGRGKHCALRLDSAEISSNHARIGFEGRTFWVEDLGSTNGTFVGNSQVSGRVEVSPETPIVLGRDIAVVGVISAEQLEEVGQREAPSPSVLAAPQARYPCLISVSEVARPARLTVPKSLTLRVGRDQTSDMWLGAPHVSRMHCTIALNNDGDVVVTDHSTNGTAYDGGVLRRGATLVLRRDPRVFDFGGSVTLGVCFSESDEEKFLQSHGMIDSFRQVTGDMGHVPEALPFLDAPPGLRRSSSDMGDQYWGDQHWPGLSKIGITSVVVIGVCIAMMLWFILEMWKGVK